VDNYRISVDKPVDNYQKIGGNYFFLMSLMSLEFKAKPISFVFDS
jgi:hypothetical protein